MDICQHVWHTTEGNVAQAGHFLRSQLVAQEKRHLGEEPVKAVEVEVKKLQDASFIKEVKYIT